MEAQEIIEGAVERINPKAIIIVDALAARDVTRLGKTVQLSDTGLSPGSGVGNSRTELSKKTLGVKCVTVGVPTVVDA
jgi:spore protease